MLVNGKVESVNKMMLT